MCETGRFSSEEGKDKKIIYDMFVLKIIKKKILVRIVQVYECIHLSR